MCKRLFTLILCLMILILLPACSSKSWAEQRMSDIATGKHEPSYTTKSTPSHSARDLDIDLLEDKLERDYYWLTYKITNTHAYHTFSYVEVEVELLDSDKKVLTSDWTYAVDSHGLDAGDSQEFDLMIKAPLSGEVAYFNIIITDYD